MNTVAGKGTLTGRATAAMQDVLAGKRRGPGSALLFAGPAVITSIAYMDPGNFATNIQAGAQFGYALLWVVLMANVIAMLFQALSARLGIATGRNLAELCRERFPPRVVLAMWVVSEIAAMATDLAEFLGGAIALALLLHIPLLAGMAITAAITCAILAIDKNGFRPMELMIGVLVAAIGLCYVAEMFIAPIAWGDVARHTFIPSLPALPKGEALTVAVGIVGATVMPHAIFLHSGLMQARFPSPGASERRQLMRFSGYEVVVALGVAGLVNMAMVIMASAAFHPGHSGVADIGVAYSTLTPLLGAGAAGLFLVSLICAGVSSSVVGTLAGQLIMQGFVGFRIPVWVRRAVTMVPAFVVVAMGWNPTQALVMSQVVLSLALPVPMIALVYFTRRRDVMGEFANNRLTDAAAIAATAVIVVLNLVLVVQAVS
ncbi:Nramp family divalent metal transporter [Paraburkholderia acidisoli]|uniref:Divalent metal cation transporter MntH n=1 Tax=Paraburkholderia acidisoli TaxID=2571748 RepID=A0A7Z2GNE0_9BURK|nr:Nramp family divalent metal transporter [Paraburkholderia acidisoli]QGZ64918.1 Mn(2+) uptake NRAMP transporter MntH [Paraburkholderia acidisoli]